MQRLGKYEIICEIGRGAMGSVYKARDPLIDRLVALKTITSGVSSQANSLERFYQEARSIGALQHPHIIIIYELSYENNMPFIAMEYIEGESLAALIEHRVALPLSMKLGFIVHVCEALSYAHGHSVVHRDIKPGNIMVTKDGVVKVVDFGIARLTDMSLTQPNVMIGSRAYMSPQLYKGERADARADIWAVGVTLYELLAYRRPFIGDNEAELMYRIISDNPPELQSLGVDCPEDLSRIVWKMLEKKADDRYQSMEDVLHDLEPLWKSAQQATVVGLIADCQELIAANDLQRAQALLRKALQIDAGNTQVKALLEKVTVELRRTLLLPKVNEHLERGRSFLQIGKLREARGEAEAALGLDSKHEPAQRLFADVETAAARAREVEQKLRITKQRLAEGALTEAAAALGQALELDGSNAQAQELRRQIDEESNRREHRRKLGELLHHARTLWTGLNYEECLEAIGEGLKEFPDEPELLKLQEMTRHDLEELQKQRQLAEVRRLLGQEEFAAARKIIDALAKKHPQDSAVKKLQTIVFDGQREQDRKKKLAEQLTLLRGLVSGSKFGEAVTKGDALLREFPEEFELKELVAYARGEIAALEQKQREKERERHIERLMKQEKYAEAEDIANRAAQEFPKQEVFRSLSLEAGKHREEQQARERTRQEMQRRIKEISNREMEQNHHLSEAQTFLEKGDFAAATQILNHALATQIFDASDARVQQTLQEIQRRSSAAKGRPAETERRAADQDSGGMTRPAAAAFSATMAGGGARISGTRANVLPPSPAGNSVAQKTISALTGDGRTDIADLGPQQREPLFAPVPVARDQRTERRDSFADFRAKVIAVSTQALANLRKPIVLAGIGAVALAASLVVLLSGVKPSKQEIQLRDRAGQLWNQHQLDEAEQTWRQLEQLHGKLQNDASRHLSAIAEKRSLEQQRFDQGLALKGQDAAAAKRAFQEVQDMNLWRTEDAKRELEALAVPPPPPPTEDPSIQEKAHFDRGVQFFQSRNYDLARQEFLAVRELNVANSTTRPDAEKYLRRIKQNADDKALFDRAMQDIKNENWTEAHDKLQQILGHNGSLSGDATQKMGEVTGAQRALDEFAKSLQGEAFSAARSQVDAMPWPKTKSMLTEKLQAAQRERLDELQSRANSLIEKGDAEGLERLEDELGIFVTRLEDADVKQAVKHFDDSLRPVIDKLKDDPEVKKLFDAAVADFFRAKQARDIKALDHRVKQQFQAIAAKNGRYQAGALAYVNSTIPTTILELTKNPAGKVLVPALNCVGSGSTNAPDNPSLASVSCAQLDEGLALQWSETYMVDFPDVANQSGKLPYTLKLIVTVDPGGRVKVDKDGNADKNFLKKVKDASKNWKTNVPKSGGKPVTVRLPLSITFQR